MSRSAPTRVYIGIGSNLQQPTEQVRRAIDALRTLPDSRLVSVSRLYRSKPLGPADQPDYINAVAALDTGLAPLQLLDALQALESQQGRTREGTRWGPRVIDLDVLLYGGQTIAEDRLVVPHPGLPRRSFVLYPLNDVAPGIDIPGHGSLDVLLAGIDADDLEPLSPA